MRRLLSRVDKASEKTEAVILQWNPPDEDPATVKWCTILKIYLKHFEKQEMSPVLEAVLARLHKSIAQLEQHNANPFYGYYSAHLEYYCQNCIYMLSWGHSPSWKDHNTVAFLEPDYEERMAWCFDGMEREKNSRLLESQ